MSELESAVRRSAAYLERSERLRIILATGAILCVLLLAVGLLRLYRLSEIPPGINSGEAANGLDALRVLQGEHAVFFPEKVEGREGMVVYAMAVTIALLGRTELALHLPSALAGAGTVFILFWLGRVLFARDEASGRPTPWRGLLVAGAGAGLLAASLSETIITRTAFRPPFFPLFLTLCMVLAWEGWTMRSRWRVALAGVCAGLLPYTYIPARFAPFLFLLFALTFVLTFRRAKADDERANSFFDTSRTRAELPWAGLFVGVAAIVAAPIILHFALNPEHFISRTGRLSVFDQVLSKGNPLEAFLSNAWHHLLVFGFRGDPFWRHSYAEQPMLNPWEAFFFWLGVGLAVWRWQRPAYRLLLLWIAVLIFPAMLSTDAGVGFIGPNTLRMVGAAPAVYLLIGVAIWETFDFIRKRFRAFPWGNGLTNWEHRNVPAIAVSAFVAGLVLVRGVDTYRTYFQDWAAAPEVFEAYHQHWTELARLLNEQAPSADNLYLIPYNDADRPFGFDYLYQGAAPAHIKVATTPHNLAQKVESTLAAERDFTTVNYVDWNDDYIWIEYGDEHVLGLLSKYGRYLGAVQYASFEIHSYSDVASDLPWTRYEFLEPVTVDYDGGISLLGLGLGQGEAQLSIAQIPNLDGTPAPWLALQWRVAPGLEIDYSASLRLHNAQGGHVFQKDFVLKNSGPATTSHWTADETVDTLIYLDLPNDLPPGDYGVASGRL